jgi:hypothetical protein
MICGTCHGTRWVCEAHADRPWTIIRTPAGGAEITVDPQVEIPSEFTLLLTEDGRVRRHCRLASREETQIQVYFISRRMTVLES